MTFRSFFLTDKLAIHLFVPDVRLECKSVNIGLYTKLGFHFYNDHNFSIFCIILGLGLRLDYGGNFDYDGVEDIF